MGLFDSITGGISKVFSGDFKQALEGIGQLATQAAISYFMPGLGGGLLEGLGGMAGLGGGGASSIFGGVAEKFLGEAGSMCSSEGLGTVGSFLKSCSGSSDMLAMAKDLFSSQESQRNSNSDKGLEELGRQNLMQMFAAQQAQQLNFG